MWRWYGLDCYVVIIHALPACSIHPEKNHKSGDMQGILVKKSYSLTRFARCHYPSRLKNQAIHCLTSFILHNSCKFSASFENKTIPQETAAVLLALQHVKEGVPSNEANLRSPGGSLPHTHASRAGSHGRPTSGLCSSGMPTPCRSALPATALHTTCNRAHAFSSAYNMQLLHSYLQEANAVHTYSHAFMTFAARPWC